MDPILLVVIIVAAAAIVAIAAMVLARRNGSTDVAALTERLTQLTESHAASQAQLAQQLQVQERALAKALDERLAQTTTRVNETLEKNSHTQKTSLDEIKERLVRIDAAQQNITELSSQMVGLQDILSNKQARGAFGEVQLHDLVSSVLPPGGYQFQATLGNGRRADCLLDLPNPPGPIVIDAKFPLESYRALQNAETDEARKAAARAFAVDVMKHVSDIADKYILPGETADAALMFLPSEAVYAELHAHFGEVVDKSYRAKVFIVSPTTLWATLNTVRAVLKDVHMKEAAGLIQREVMTLMTDVQRLDKRVGNLQRHFDQAGEDMREVRISTEKITKRGDRIQDLEIEGATADEPTLLSSASTPKLRETG
ncbi:MAG: DNA recombination protein RmuC [Alphaproteobacteria bacterium]|nr:DNA recombination protein RmuC [Alphaproteobacteria bacterium]